MSNQDNTEKQIALGFWFSGIWFGFVGYLIAKAASLEIVGILRLSLACFMIGAYAGLVITVASQANNRRKER